MPVFYAHTFSLSLYIEVSMEKCQTQIANKIRRNKIKNRFVRFQFHPVPGPPNSPRRS